MFSKNPKLFTKVDEVFKSIKKVDEVFKSIKKVGMNFAINKNFIFRGREQYLDHAAPVEGSSPLPGASPISKSDQKVVKTKQCKHVIFVKSRFLLGCDRLLPFFIPNNSQNPPPRTHPGRPLFTFLGGEIAHGITKS